MDFCRYIYTSFDILEKVVNDTPRQTGTKRLLLRISLYQTARKIQIHKYSLFCILETIGQSSPFIYKIILQGFPLHSSEQIHCRYEDQHSLIILQAKAYEYIMNKVFVRTLCFSILISWTSVWSKSTLTVCMIKSISFWSYRTHTPKQMHYNFWAKLVCMHEHIHGSLLFKHMYAYHNWAHFIKSWVRNFANLL